MRLSVFLFAILGCASSLASVAASNAHSSGPSDVAYGSYQQNNPGVPMQNAPSKLAASSDSSPHASKDPTAALISDPNALTVVEVHDHYKKEWPQVMQYLRDPRVALFFKSLELKDPGNVDGDWRVDTDWVLTPAGLTQVVALAQAVQEGEVNQYMAYIVAHTPSQEELLKQASAGKAGGS